MLGVNTAICALLRFRGVRLMSGKFIAAVVFSVLGRL